MYSNEYVKVKTKIVRNEREGRGLRDIMPSVQGIMPLVHQNNNRRVNSESTKMRGNSSHSF